jgi:hypothetical protein
LAKTIGLQQRCTLGASGRQGVASDPDFHGKGLECSDVASWTVSAPFPALWGAFDASTDNLASP